jgi:microcystin-dependent protein
MDPFVAEIRIFPFNFAPTGWAFCNGQLLPISQNTALFALLGTTYGGDGKSTFALPNLVNNCAVGAGQGPGLSDYFLGQESGSENVTLIITEIPAHNHSLMTTVEDGTQGSLTQGITIATSVGGPMYQTVVNQQNVNMAFQSLSVTGSSFPHNNMMPYLTLNMCIALQGVFPPRP